MCIVSIKPSHPHAILKVWLCCFCLNKRNPSCRDPQKIQLYWVWIEIFLTKPIFKFVMIIHNLCVLGTWLGYICLCMLWIACMLHSLKGRLLFKCHRPCWFYFLGYWVYCNVEYYLWPKCEKKKDIVNIPLHLKNHDRWCNASHKRASLTKLYDDVFICWSFDQLLHLYAHLSF